MQLKVPGTATMRHVLEAVAQELGRPEVSKRGRLVERKGGGYSTLEDTCQLSTRRELLMLGVDNLEAARVPKSGGG